MINRATANACPICRAKADTFDLRKNTTLAIVVEHFRGLRKDLADALVNTKSGIVVSNSTAAASEAGKRTMTGAGKEITGRLSQFNLHGLSKDKVKKIIEQATKDSRVKLRLEGDKDALERRLKDLVHLHNAQLGAINPLTLDQVIEKINVQSLVMEKEQLKAYKTIGSVEKLKNGQETVEIASNFKKLAQLAKKAKKKTTAATQEAMDVEATEEEAAAEAPMMQETEASRLASRMLEDEAGPRTQSTSNADDWTWLDQVPLAVRQDWQIVFSKKLQRPFFFHLVTKTGQFGIPDSFEVYRYRGAPVVPSSMVSQSAVRAETVDASESQEPVRRSGRRQSTKSGPQDEAMTKTATSSSTPPEDDGLTASSQRSRRSQSAKRPSPNASSSAAVAPSSSSSSSSSSSRESALLFTASPDETVRTSLEEEERLFLTADSQDTTGSDDFLLTDDGTPTPPPSTTRVATSSSSNSAVLGRRSTVVVVGSNAPAAAAVPSTADVAPTALDDVEMIDMTQLPEASPTQLDAELLPQRRDAADHDAGSISSVMLLDDSGEGDDEDMSPSQPRRKAPRVEDAPVASPGVASLPSGAQSPASQRRRRGVSSAEASSSQALSQSQATTPAGSHSSDNGGGPWACAVCTYVNAQPRAKCEVCDSANPSFLNLASRPKRAASTSTMTPTAAPSGASFSYNADALRRMQQLSSSASTASQSSSKKRKLQQSSITSALSK
eukprot:gene1567-1136_t